jgi:hypothetical protein
MGVAHMTQGQKLSGRCEILLSSAGLIHSPCIQAVGGSFLCAQMYHLSRALSKKDRELLQRNFIRQGASHLQRL